MLVKPREILFANSFAAVHGTYMANTWDFYKPDLSAEYVCAILMSYDRSLTLL